MTEETPKLLVLIGLVLGAMLSMALGTVVDGGARGRLPAILFRLGFACFFGSFGALALMKLEQDDRLPHLAWWWFVLPALVLSVLFVAWPRSRGSGSATTSHQPGG
jgi:hypothetical protein